MKKISLSIPQRKFMKKLVETNGNATVAAMSAYPNMKYESAAVEGSRLLRNPKIQAGIQNALDGKGLSEGKLAEKLKKLTESQKPVVVNNKVQMFDDNPTQLSSVRTALQLRGHLKTGAVVINNQNQQVGPFIKTKEDLERMEAVVRRLDEINKKMLSGFHSTGEEVHERQPHRLPKLSGQDHSEAVVVVESKPLREFKEETMSHETGGFC